MRHLFAPIPHVHVESALATASERGRVALGSNQLDAFERLRETEEDTTVWLCVSTGYVPDGGVSGGRIGKVVARGRLEGAAMGDRRGRCLTPEVRPPSTGEDGEWTFFYTVSDVTPVDPPIPSATLRPRSGGRIEAAPHALVRIHAPVPEPSR